MPRRSHEPVFAWTDARVATLRKMWGDGESAGAIARALGGVTASAVIGKVHRLGLPTRARAAKPVRTRMAPAPRKAAVRRPAPCAVPAPAADDDIPAATVSWADRTFEECAWPVGETAGRDTRCCGRPVSDPEPGKSKYCEAHKAAARSPVQPKPMRDWTGDRNIRRASRGGSFFGAGWMS